MAEKKRDNIRIISFTGEKVRNFIPEIAKLRVEVFREYPFLYIGDFDYEKRYLEKFTQMKDAIVTAAFDNETLIGIATGFPFIYEAENLQNVFKDFQRDPKEYYCFGESVLKKQYRGIGIGKRFYEERENFARSVGYRYICLYTIIRDPDDPKRPPNYRDLSSFWEARGFVKHPELVGTVSYQEINEEQETPKEMIFWIKEL